MSEHLALPVTKAKCPLCGDFIEKGDEKINCLRCDTIHHKECWEYLGDCAILGCQSDDLVATENQRLANEVRKWGLLHQTHSNSLRIFSAGIVSSLLLYTLLPTLLLFVPLQVFPSIAAGIIFEKVMLLSRLISAGAALLGFLGLLAVAIPFHRSKSELEELSHSSNPRTRRSALSVVRHYAVSKNPTVSAMLSGTFSCLLFSSFVINVLVLSLSFTMGNLFYLMSLFNLLLLVLSYYYLIPKCKKVLKTGMLNASLSERLIEMIKDNGSA